MKLRGIAIRVVHRDGRVLMFGSVTELAKHFSLSTFKVHTFLKQRTEITEEDYERLNQMSYEPRSWKHSGQNRKRSQK